MPLTDGLYEFWQLNESSGTRAGSLAVLNLPIQAADPPSANFNPEFNVSVQGNAVMDGSGGGFVGALGGPDLTSEDPLTVSAWFKQTVRLNDQLVIAGKGSEFGDGNSWVLALDDDLSENPLVSFTIGTNYTCILTTPFREAGKPILGEWHHVVAFYNPGTGMPGGQFMGIYIDNVLRSVRQVPSSTIINNNPRVFSIGGMIDTFFLDPRHNFRGMLANVGVWQRMLSSAEVGNLYNGGKMLTYPFSLP